MNPGSSRYLSERNESTTPARQNLIIQLVNINPGHPPPKRGRLSFKKEGKFLCAKSVKRDPNNNSVL